MAKGDGCDGVPLGDGIAIVDLPKTWAKQTVQVDVTSINVTDDDIDLDCFVRVVRPALDQQFCFPVTVPGRSGPCA